MTKAEATAALLAKGLAPLGLTRAEAAALLGISERTFRRRVKDGKLPPANAITGRWPLAAVAAVYGSQNTSPTETVRDAIDAAIDEL